jgi:hypothetical protein
LNSDPGVSADDRFGAGVSGPFGIEGTFNRRCRQTNTLMVAAELARQVTADCWMRT